MRACARARRDRVIESVLDHDHRLRADVLTTPRVRRLRRYYVMIPRPLPDLHSFPTRRSSDLAATAAGVSLARPQRLAAGDVQVQTLADEVSDTRRGTHREIGRAHV